MNKKTIYIIVAVLVVIIVVAGAVIALTYKAPAKKAAVTVAEATSLQFSVNSTQSGAATTTLNWAGENIGTSNLIIRVDYPASNFSCIMNYATNQSWQSLNSGTTWTSDVWSTDLSSWGARWTGVMTTLDAWNGTATTYTYTDTSTSPATTVVVYNISINPTIPASEFATS